MESLNSCVLHEIHNDLKIEVLSWLPAKALGCLRRVNKATLEMFLRNAEQIFKLQLSRTSSLTFHEVKVWQKKIAKLTLNPITRVPGRSIPLKEVVRGARDSLQLLDLYEKNSYQPGCISAQLIHSISRPMPQLVDLRLRGIEMRALLLEKVAQNTGSLRAFTYWNSTEEWDNFTDKICSIIRKNPHLENLAVDGLIYVGDPLLKELEQRPIKTLHLSSCKFLTNQGLYSLSCLKKVISLSLHDFSQVTAIGLSALLDLPCLRKLEFMGLASGPITPQEIIKGICKLKKLTSLKLMHCKLTDAQASSFASLNKLEYLDLTENYAITGQGVREIVSLLPRLHTLVLHERFREEDFATFKRDFPHITFEGYIEPEESSSEEES